MKILVITNSTAKKIFSPPNQLTSVDFVDRERLNRRTHELRRYETPAAQMYTGDGHLRLMDGVKNLRRTFGPDVVNLYIISPGYGLLNEETPIVPYDYTFDGLQKLEIHPEIKRLLSSYDLAFFLLSEPYLTACQLPFRVSNSATQIFLIAPGLLAAIPANRPYIHAVTAGVELMVQLEGANKFNLKGVVFERLCKAVCNRGHQVFDDGERNPPTEGGAAFPGGSAHQVFEEVRRNPQRIIEMVLDCNRRL